MIPMRAWPDGLEPGSQLCRDVREGVVYGCILSPGDDPSHRYALWAIWDDFLPKLGMVGTNPSRATHKEDDPTWKRQRVRADRLGYGGLLLMNGAAIRDTDRLRAMRHPEAIGRDNETWLSILLPICDRHILCYGADLKRCGGDLLVRRVFSTEGLPAYALGINADGSPGHPLYISYDTEPFPYEWSPS